MYSETVKDHSGKVTNKWSSYLKYYDLAFSYYRNNKIKLLEIGVQNGGSLEVYSKYFKYASLILGCDIDEKCGKLTFDDNRIKVLVGDAREQALLQKISEMGPFDIIVDDGSHHSPDVIINFLNYFPLLAHQGLYVVEDTHYVYQQGLGFKNTSCFEFFKLLSDHPNIQFWAKNYSDIESRFGQFFSVPPNLSILVGTIESIEFRNSIIGVKKSEKVNLNQLGEQIIRGDEATVDQAPILLRQAILSNKDSAHD